MDPKSPAFPSNKGRSLTGVGYVPAPGISIREYIAVEAMKGILSASFDESGEYNFGIVAQRSFEYADALIDQSNK